MNACIYLFIQNFLQLSDLSSPRSSTSTPMTGKGQAFFADQVCKTPKFFVLTKCGESSTLIFYFVDCRISVNYLAKFLEEKECESARDVLKVMPPIYLC